MTTKESTETSQNIMIDVSKADFKKAIKAHKRFSLIGKGADQTAFGCIQFEIKEDKLILSSTDGNGALKSEIKIIENFGKQGTFCISTELLNKLAFPKGKLFDTIKISSDEENAEFVDYEFNLSQLVKIKKDLNFPEIEKVMPLKNDFIVRVSLSHLKDLSYLYSQTGLVDFCFDTKNNLRSVVIKSTKGELEQSALIMPWSQTEE